MMAPAHMPWPLQADIARRQLMDDITPEPPARCRAPLLMLLDAAAAFTIYFIAITDDA